MTAPMRRVAFDHRIGDLGSANRIASAIRRDCRPGRL